MRPWIAAALTAMGIVSVAAAAGTGVSGDDAVLRQLERTAADVASLKAEVAGNKALIADLSARLAVAEKAASLAKAAIMNELAQPMLLLVGEAPCPSGFKRIGTRVFLLTRPRTRENAMLFDQAGLVWEDQPGVGDNVYRDLDFCFRMANSVKLD